MSLRELTQVGFVEDSRDSVQVGVCLCRRCESSRGGRNCLREAAFFPSRGPRRPTVVYLDARYRRSCDVILEQLAQALNLGSRLTWLESPRDAALGRDCFPFDADRDR